MPSTLVWNSGGPPRMSLLATVAPPAAGAVAAGADAAGADPVGAAAGWVDDAAGAAGVDFFELQALTLRATAAPAAPRMMMLRFMGLLGWRVEWSSDQRVGEEHTSSDCCDLRLDDVGGSGTTDGDGLIGEAARHPARNGVALDHRKNEIAHKREQRDEHTAADHLGKILLREPVVDEATEPAEGQVRRDGGGRDYLK